MWHCDIHFSCLSLCHRLALTPSRQDKAVALKKLRKNVVTLSAVAGKWWPLFHPLLLFIRKKCHPNLKKWNGKKALWPKRFSGCILFFHTFDYQRILGKLCHSGQKCPKVTRLQFQNYLGWYRRVLAPPMATYVAQWDLFRGIFPHCVLCRIRRQSIIVWVHKSWLLWNLEERNYYCSSSLSLSFFSLMWISCVTRDANRIG